MPLYAQTNQEQHEIDNKRVSFSADPLRVLMRLEDKAVAELHPEDTPDEREDRRLNLNERCYVRFFIDRNLD